MKGEELQPWPKYMGHSKKKTLFQKYSLLKRESRSFSNFESLLPPTFLELERK